MSRVIGIDLGTTNSLVAWMEDGRPRTLAGEEQFGWIPSVVAWDGDRMLVGAAARGQALVNPEETVFSVKRFMGRSLEDADVVGEHLPFRLSEDKGHNVLFALGGRDWTAPEISALILGELRDRAAHFFGEDISRAVITVPAYFNDAQRQATRDAGRIAGLDVLRIVNEPTAAALAYGLQKKSEGLVAIYDFGGGTFDVSILKLRGGIFQVLATGGDTHLGGDDIDQVLMDWILAHLREYGIIGEMVSPALLQGLRMEAERAKWSLSEREGALISVAIPDGDLADVGSKQTEGVDLDDQGQFVWSLPLGREKFEELIGPIVERSLAPCLRALSDADLETGQVDDVVLVGGTTRIPLVRRKVAELFGREPHSELPPEQVVAIGAAVQAGILAGRIRDMLLLDVTPLSLGIEGLGGVMNVIIPRNSRVPSRATEMFTTQVDGQTGVDIHVYQGERDLVRDNRSLARFRLKIEPAPAGVPRVEVAFTLDADGILQVSATDQRDGNEQSVRVKPSYGLEEEKINALIRESITHAEEDIERRLLIEARLEGESVVRATEKSLEAEVAGLSARERETISVCLADLAEKMEKSTDHREIREATGQLNDATRHLAELIMDVGVMKKLASKSVDDIQ